MGLPFYKRLGFVLIDTRKVQVDGGTLSCAKNALAHSLVDSTAFLQTNFGCYVGRSWMVWYFVRYFAVCFP
jgi:hypothetical protein